MKQKATLLMLTMIFILTLITPMGKGLVNSNMQTISNKLPYEFKLVVTGYYKRTKLPDGKWSNRQYVKTDKEYTILDFSKQGLSLYEVESVSNDKERYFRPKLDKNGNTIPLKVSNNNATEATKILNGGLEIKVLGEVPNKVFVGFMLKKEGLVGLARIFSKARNRDIVLYPIVQFMIENNNQLDSTLSLIYTDSDLNYQIRKINDKGLFDVSYQKSINPDIDNINNYLGIREMVDYGYFLSSEEGKGYLEITPNNKQFISNGRTSSIGYAPKMINGKLFVYTQWFVSQVYGFIDYSAKRHIIKRLYQRIGSDIELINVELNDDEDVITLNSTKYKLSAKPVFESDYTMMPLRDLCELLKVRLIYQPISNTYLIQRFNSNYEPPFNLKKID